MPNPIKLLLVFLFIFIAVIQAIAQESGVLKTSNDTVSNPVSQDEAILYNMINDMRQQNKMPTIPLSEALCMVAHVHLTDLIANKPQEKGCSIQGWSKSVKWTACCNTKDAAGIKCMTSKPKEITGYPGNGYELAFWGEEKATPADAAAMWKQANASADMILSRGRWKGFQWKAIGVGIKDGYAVLWLGDKTDKTTTINNGKIKEVANISKNANDTTEVVKTKHSAKETTKISVMPATNPKNNPETVKPTSSSALKYYLIVFSTKNAEIATTELNRIKSDGYPDAFIMDSPAGYRIALMYFDTPKRAAIKLNELKSKFTGIWVLKE
ncbi:MAG: hypothetical protein ACOYN4_16940 [Bacteroidales bacterium]